MTVMGYKHCGTHCTSFFIVWPFYWICQFGQQDSTWPQAYHISN